MMFNENYNPDVLSCLANLSNDEVFTPPNLVNQMLDTFPQELFKNKETTFLDPVTKSGVFLREIAKRLNKGLEIVIPNRQERLNHIFTKQLFGIAITEITALLARRSVYCTKKANSNYSICDDFKTEQGNIKFDRILHTWKNGKCTFCGASETEYKRGDQLETHAYEFIHTDEPENIYNMRFDVIIGNPPYQLNDGGGASGTSAIPIYHKFIEQSLSLNPRYLSMIVPSRWFSGGRGLGEFRDMMLNNKRLIKIFDFLEASDCFPGVQIKGGVSYFLISNKESDICEISTFKDGKFSHPIKRPLLVHNMDTFIRYNEAISILDKVKMLKESSFSLNVSSQKPFGFRSNFSEFSLKKTQNNNIKLYRYGPIGYIEDKAIKKNKNLIYKIKVIISKAGSGSDSFPHQILGVPLISEPLSVCTETYLVLGEFDNNTEANNLISYVSTKFFRFLVSLMKNTQNVSQNVFSLVPIQDYKESWSDEKLYKKYGITDDEIEFIDSMIRPMELDNE